MSTGLFSFLIYFYVATIELSDEHSSMCFFCLFIFIQRLNSIYFVN